MGYMSLLTWMHVEINCNAEGKKTQGGLKNYLRQVKVNIFLEKLILYVLIYIAVVLICLFILMPAQEVTQIYNWCFPPRQMYFFKFLTQHLFITFFTNRLTVFNIFFCRNLNLYKEIVFFKYFFH